MSVRHGAITPVIIIILKDRQNGCNQIFMRVYLTALAWAATYEWLSEIVFHYIVYIDVLFSDFMQSEANFYVYTHSK